MTTGYVVIGNSTVDSRLFIRSWQGDNGATDGAGKAKWNFYNCSTTEKVRKPIRPYGYDSFLGGDEGPVPIWSTNHENTLLAEMQHKVKGHQFNAGVALAEGRETASLVIGTIGRVARAGLAVKKGRVDLALRELGALPKDNGKRPSVRPGTPLNSKDVSGMWLEIAYGWKPLLSDVHEAMSAYSAITNKPRTTRVTVRGTSTVTNSVNSGSYKSKGETSYHRTYHYLLTEQMPVARQLGLQNPLSVAWELVPFSFVADWFIPIGTYLENLDQMPLLQGTWQTSNLTRRSAHSIGTGSWVGAVTDSRICTYERRTLGAPPIVPPPQFKSLSEALSLGHIKNGIALLHQVFT